LGTSWSLAPLLVWGLFERGIGLVLLISFASLSVQVVPAVGKGSILPIGRRLEKLGKDFPTWRRFFYFPTLLWIDASDGMLRGLTTVGLVGAAGVVYGGPLSAWALGTCYVCYLSLDLAMALLLPWDTLLFEIMVLALFLPETRALPHLVAAVAPAPALAWAFRLLFFRVIFGFGKQKFIGSRSKDAAYLKGFLINQPLLSPGGWYAQKLPMWFLKSSLYFMFFVEVPAPFFVFFPGPLSVICAVATSLLMLGIQVTGNFGYFSLLTIVASVPLLDNVTPHAFHVAGMFASGGHPFVNAFVLVHTLAAVITFPFNSWLAQGWLVWAFWYQLPRWVQIPLDFLRLLHPFRWVHPYGVFPPNTTPGVKITLLLEVTWDREQWHEVSFKYAPSNPKSAPHFVAPHHPRTDQAIIYDTFGMNYTSLLSTMLSSWDPSCYCMRSPSMMFCQAVLRAGPAALFKEGELAKRCEPLVAARITTVMLEPVTLKEHLASGDWWTRTYIGPHVPPQELDPDFDEDMLGEPELWNFDSIFWRRRSRLKPLLERALGRDDPMDVVLTDANDISPSDVERFWSELVPLIGGPVHETFDSLPETVAEVRRRFTRKERRIFYRLLGRFSLILVARLEPSYLHRGLKPLIPVKTYFDLWMLAGHVICGGRETYLAAVADPLSVVNHVPALTPSTGLYALSVFRFEEMTFDAQKLRLLEAYFHPHDSEAKRKLSDDAKAADAGKQGLARVARAVSGFINVLPFVRDAFRGPAFDHGYPELYPVFTELESGEVLVTDHGRLPKGTALPPDMKSVRE
jgi:hypothetical protein